MMVQLEPHEYLQDYYQVLNFQFSISNPNELCPTQNCVFQLEGGRMGSESTPGEKTLKGKPMINSGDTTRIRDLPVIGPQSRTHRRRSKSASYRRNLDAWNRSNRHRKPLPN